MISGCVAQAKLVSMMMMPSLVRSAHDECWRVPEPVEVVETPCKATRTIPLDPVWLGRLRRVPRALFLDLPRQAPRREARWVDRD